MGFFYFLNSGKRIRRIRAGSAVDSPVPGAEPAKLNSAIRVPPSVKIAPSGTLCSDAESWLILNDLPDDILSKSTFVPREFFIF